jgi:hypothetical protein
VSPWREGINWQENSTSKPWTFIIISETGYF